jgi:two-component system sensor histidine kinase AtoS
LAHPLITRSCSGTFPGIVPDRTAPASDPALVAAIIDVSADAILTVGADERILSWNKGAERMFGWTADEVVGQNFALLLPQEELARGELEWIHRTTSAEGAIRNYETRRKTKDGRVIDVELTRTAVYDDAGRLLGFSAIVRNISDRKRLERQLLTAERLATAGQVAAGVAHEIGAPLTAISVAVDHMMKVRCGVCAGADEMQVLLSQTDRIAKLARQLVNLAKPLGVRFAPIALNAVVEQAAGLVQTQLNKNRITLALALAPDLPTVHADEAQIQQVIINFLFNAQRAIGDAGGRIALTTRRADPDGVEIVVSDDGPGIAATDLAQLFTPFFSRTGGTGLGLALAAQTVKAHGGTIEVANNPGGGASFTVRLPIPR